MILENFRKKKSSDLELVWQRKTSYKVDPQIKKEITLFTMIHGELGDIYTSRSTTSAATRRPLTLCIVVCFRRRWPQTQRHEATRGCEQQDSESCVNTSPATIRWIKHEDCWGRPRMSSCSASFIATTPRGNDGTKRCWLQANKERARLKKACRIIMHVRVHVSRTEQSSLLCTWGTATAG